MPLFNKFVVIIILVFSGSFLSLAQQTKNISPAGTNFLLYVPSSYQEGTPAPLLVCLHGRDGIGNDLDLILVNRDESPALLIHRNSWPVSRPYIVLSPQLPRDESITNPADQTWSPTLVNEVVEHVLKNYTIDRNRIYFTGLSLGAAGVWSYAIEYPDVPAALLPISGAADSIQACNVADVPIWAFHGSIDGTVQPYNSIGMANQINLCSNRRFNSKLNLLHVRIHEPAAWNNVWNHSNSYQVFDWLLQHAKDDSNNRMPYVNAGFNRRMLIRESPITLYGDFFDFDGTIESVEWRKLTGPDIVLSNADTHFVSLTQLKPGNYTFELRVVDNDGMINSDTVDLELIDIPPVGEALINNIMLVNGDDNIDIGNLYEGQILNKYYVLNNELKPIKNYNLRASGNTNTLSIRYRINTDGNIRNLNGNSLYIRPVGVNEWPIPVDEYSICATAYRRTLIRDEGLTECYRVSVFDQPIRTYYSKPSVDISDLNSWSSESNGSGTSPTSFTGNFQVFNVQTSASVGAPLTVGGVESIFWVKTGGTVRLNNQFNGVINTESNSTVIVNTPQPVIFGVVDPNSTIIFDQAATVIPSGNYGHVEVRGAGSVKSLSPGNTVVAGNFTLGAGVSLQGAVENNSIVSVAGNVSIAGTTSFLPARPFELSFTSGATQQLSAEPPIIQFKKINLLSAAQVTVSGNTTLRLGDATGGGLAIENSSRFNLGSANLEIVGGGTINTQNQTGTIGFNGGTLSISSTSAGHSNIYTVSGSDVVNTMAVNNSGGGQVIIRNALFITDVLTCQNGTIVSNGNITLVSTADKTASLAPVGATAVITGDLNIQRFIHKGRQYRYLSVPVKNFSVADLQPFIPVTGNFAVSTPGFSTNPSMFHYDEPTGGWKPFPSVNNSENLVLGKGYAVFVRDDLFDTKIIATGEVHTGDFQFTLTPDPNETEEDNGWNLIGNPYASAILWRENGWSRTGVNDVIYVRDNSVNGGRFLMWDGQLGDVEFSGRIAQGQSFWVRTVNESPQLIVQEAAKTSTQASLFRTSEAPDFESLIISMHQEDQYDRCYVKFVKSASDKFDNYRDAIKRSGESFNIALQTSDSVKVALKNSVLDFCEKEYPLTLIQALPGSYSLSAEGSVIDGGNYQVFLLDSYLDSVHQVSALPYAFELTEDENSSDPARFKIRVILQRAMPIISSAGNKLISNYQEGNQWYKEGTPLPGATYQEFEPTESGLYTLAVTYAGCARQSEPINYVVTALENQASINQIKVYPNPADGRVYIETVRSQHPAESDRIEYSVYSVMGRLIQQGTLENSMVDDGRHAIDMPYPSGVYFLILRSNKNTRMLKLILN
jgi:predicted esterase